MKKIFLTFSLLLIGICAFAQKGEKAAGLNLNFGTTASNVGLGAKFQYGITDAIRIEPSLTYYFGGTGMFDITGNVHYLFDVATKIKVYPLAGIGLDMCRYEFESGSMSYENGEYIEKKESSNGTNACFKFNIGAGAEYSLTNNISAGLELRYEVITSGYSQFVVGIGATYKF